MRWSVFVLLLCLAVPSVSGQELVSKRIAEAIAGGKFYMKLNVNTAYKDDSGKSQKMSATSAIAIKQGVTMTRMEGFDHVSLEAGGHTYLLNEAAKSYSVAMQNPEEEAFDLSLDFGRLSFQRQGTCTINGASYWWDRYGTESGRYLIFYYNSSNIAAVNFGPGEDGNDIIVSLLSFDNKIPDNMYFCVGPEWERNNLSGVNLDEYIPADMKVEGIPEGVSVKDLAGGNKKKQKDALSKMIDPKDLPEGMNMDDLMRAMSGDMSAVQKQMGAAGKGQPSSMSDILKQAGEVPGVDKTALGELAGGVNNVQEMQAAAENAPDAPICPSPWKDTSAGEDLAAGLNLGEIKITNSKPLSEQVYLASFSKTTPVRVNTSLDVTDEGIWKAFDQLTAQTKGMTDAQAMEHLLKECDDMIGTMEIGCVTGEVIERAVATCMLCPSAAVYNNTAMLFAYKGDTQTALNYFQRAEELSAGNPVIEANIAECLFETGDFVKARQYIQKAVTSEPTYGTALQMLTSLNLKEGKSIDAANSLFKTMCYYFSDITATQVMSLNTALGVATAKTDADFDMKALFDQVFSPANLEMLRQATKSGFIKPVNEIPAAQKKFDYFVNRFDLRRTWQSLKGKQQEFSEYQLSLLTRQDELIEADLSIVATQSMGLQNIYAEADAIVGQFAPNMKVPGMDANMNPYKMASMVAKNGNSGSYLSDARQYWCLQLFRTYYESQLAYYSGNWARWEDNGTMKGSYPSQYASLLNEIEQIEELFNKNREALMQDMTACTEAEMKCNQEAQTERAREECELNYLKCVLPYHVQFAQMFSAKEYEKLAAKERYYRSYLQPVMEEFWATMATFVGYCDNINLIEYIMLETTRSLNEKWQDAQFVDGIVMGQGMEHAWQNVLDIEKRIGIQESIVSQLPADPPKLVEKKDTKLRNFGEKEKADFNIGINTPFGRVAFIRDRQDYKFSTENTATGVTTIENLSNGSTTTYTTYESLAHTPEPPKGYLQTAAEWLAMRSVGKLTDAVGDRVLKGHNHTGFIPSTETDSGVRRMRTVDSQGNVTEMGIMHFRNRSVGISDVGARIGQTRIRTGNHIKVENHLRLSFKFVDMQFKL